MTYTQSDLDAAWRAGRDAAAVACDDESVAVHARKFDQLTEGALAALYDVAERIRALQPPAASKP